MALGPGDALMRREGGLCLFPKEKADSARETIRHLGKFVTCSDLKVRHHRWAWGLEGPFSVVLPAQSEHSSTYNGVHSHLLLQIQER